MNDRHGEQMNRSRILLFQACLLNAVSEPVALRGRIVAGDQHVELAEI